MRAFLEIASVLPVIDGVGDEVGGDDGTKHVDLLRNPTGLHLNVPPVPQPTYNKHTIAQRYIWNDGLAYSKSYRKPVPRELVA